MKVTRKFTCRQCGMARTVKQWPSQKPLSFCDSRCVAEFFICQHFNLKPEAVHLVPVRARKRPANIGKIRSALLAGSKTIQEARA
jgi:hypothetical protein